MIENKIKLATMNPKIVSKEIGDFVVEEIKKYNCIGGVIGLSGGVDSTVSAALSKIGFDNYNKRLAKKRRIENLELVGYILPSNTNNIDDAEDGIKVAQKLGIRYEIVDIEPVVEAFKITNPEAFQNKYDAGNLMSRIRANILNTKAATEKKLVIGTGNRDEDFGIGYYTLFGDGAVHISPIGALPKRLVKEMAVYLGFPDAAKRVPTAGLEPGQTDFGDLGYDYDSVEIVTECIELINYWRAEGLQKTGYEDMKGYVKEIADTPMVREVLLHQIKESKKFNSVDDAVSDILRRHYTAALPKGELIRPKIAKITLNSN